jgi:hypothetical protein
MLYPPTNLMLLLYEPVEARAVDVQRSRALPLRLPRWIRR